MKKLDWNKLKELWEQGLNDGQIAVQLGTNQVVVCNIRKRLGLESKWKRGRKNHEFLKKEIEDNRVVFYKDYSQLEKLKLNRDYALCVGVIRRVAIPKIRMKKGVPNMKKQILFYKNGDTEVAFQYYMNRFSDEQRDLLELKPKVMTRKINFIRKFFNLGPVYNWGWEAKNDV